MKGRYKNMKTTVNTNEEYKGIEIYFEGFPYGKTRAILKVNGFRWHNGKRCWYAKDTNERRKIALQVAKREEKHELERPEEVKADTVTAEEVTETATTYRYGMRVRGFSIGCQPMNGFIERLDDTTGKYYDILVYDRPLKDYEVSHFSLDYIESSEAVTDEPEAAEEVKTEEAAEEATKEPVNSLGVVIQDKPKKAKRTATQKAFESLKKSGSHLTKWNGVFEGTVYSCNGYTLMITTETIEEAETIERADVDRMESMKKATKEAAEKVYKLDFTTKELKAAISQLKAGKRKATVAYVFEEGGLMINASFLLQAMEVTGSNTVMWNTEKSPVYMENETTFIMVCPVNNSNKLSKGLHLI